MPAFLKIENIGVCPPEGFTVLGVSLADTSDKPVRHPQIGEVFERDDNGSYKPRNAMLN